MMSGFFSKNNYFFRYIAIGFLVFSVLLIYLAPFFIFEQSSKQASLVRISLFFASLYFVSTGFENGKKFFLSRFGYLSFSVFLLFFYLLMNSLVLSEDYKAVRRLVLLACLFIPFFYINIDPRKTRFILVVIASVISFSAVFSLFNHYFNGTLPRGYRQGGLIDSGVNGFAGFGNTIVAGMHYAIAFSIVTYLYFTEKNRSLLIVWGVFKFFLFVYIALTFARTAWVAVFISFAVIFLMTFRKDQFRFYIPVALLIPAFVYFYLNFAGYEFGERGLTYRDEAWLYTLSKMEGHWFFGHGLLNSIGWIPIKGGTTQLNNSHSLYLEIVYQAGMVGLVLHLCCVISAIYVLFKLFLLGVYRDLSILLIAILCSISVVMTVDIIGWVNSPGLVWMWLWCPLAISIVFERKLHEVKS